MIRLVVSDIDGTLVRKDKSLSDVNVAAVGRLVDAGIAVTLISARPPSGMMWIAESLKLAGPFGAFNGGTLFMADGTVTEHHMLDDGVAGEVLAHLEGQPVIRWLFADGDWLASEADGEHTPREIKSAGVQPIVGPDFGDRVRRADKIVAVTDDVELLDRIEQEVKALVGDRATVARSQTYYLDITAPVGNKGDGITALCKAYHVVLEDTVALGDQANDLPMFARAAYSVAMGQAPDPVKAAAKDIAASNDDDGVADAIDRFILPKVQK
ncbi:HAD family hydrolase [Sphingomonas bacterium]|uniref:HAD family hydrolase n=1 Tax=Sphingomonas bacterium TaxID=1895847 RepID=UPI001574FF1B|nr:HAD family hydrolase [Sphingomonas bacterium]